MTHCIECGVKPGDIIQLGDNDRHVTVKLVKSRYGPLCQRHARNTYARSGTAKKRKSKREVEVKRLREEFGQKSMFPETENKNEAS